MLNVIFGDLAKKLAVKAAETFVVKVALDAATETVKFSVSVLKEKGYWPENKNKDEKKKDEK